MKVLVTGGSGFIGSALIRKIIAETDWEVTNFDNLTYAACPPALALAEQSKRYNFVHGDVTRGDDFEAFAWKHYDFVFHLAAESDVTRSLHEPGRALDTNAFGVFNVLERLRYHARRFVFVSTDEVYGSLPVDAPPLKEDAPLAPSTPYACGKAMGDLLVHTWVKTRGVDACITRCTNNYGPYQNQEKLIPRMVARCLAKQPLTIHGSGTQSRDWIHVDDHAAALMHVAQRGVGGQVYHVGANQEVTNREVIESIGAILGHSDYVTVEDRVANDTRYALDASKLKTLGWSPKHDFRADLPALVQHFSNIMRP